MHWSSPQCPTAQEFRHLYLSRLDKMNSRFQEDTSKKTHLISQVVVDKETYCLKGIVKRLEFRRVRAFEKHFQ